MKKLVFVSLGALFLSAGVFALTSLSAKEKMSDLMLANIEAMTQIEGNPTMPCSGTMGYDCNGWGYISTKCIHIVAAASCSVDTPTNVANKLVTINPRNVGIKNTDTHVTQNYKYENITTLIYR